MTALQIAGSLATGGGNASVAPPDDGLDKVRRTSPARRAGLDGRTAGRRGSGVPAVLAGSQVDPKPSSLTGRGQGLACAHLAHA